MTGYRGYGVALELEERMMANMSAIKVAEKTKSIEFKKGNRIELHECQNNNHYFLQMNGENHLFFLNNEGVFFNGVNGEKIKSKTAEIKKVFKCSIIKN